MRLLAIPSVRPSAAERKAVMNTLKKEKQLAVISALVEGNSIRSTERMTGVHRDTIMRLTLRVGEQCLKLLDETMRNLTCPNLQIDELWCYVAKHQRRLSYEERFNREVGDQYVFVALDADTKLIPHFDVGTIAMSFTRPMARPISTATGMNAVERIRTQGSMAAVALPWAAPPA